MARVLETMLPARLGRSFRWLVASSWTSNLGDGLSLAAAPLLVASATRDPFLIAASVVLQRLPWPIFGLLAGVVADRADRRRVILTVDLARAAVIAGLAVAVAADAASIGLILITLFVLGTGEVFADTTSQTVLPMIVDPDDLPIGNARLMAGFVTVNQLVGPPVGAALFAAGHVWPFAIQAGCVALGAFCVSRIALPSHGVERAARANVLREIADGWRWLWHHAAVRTLAITIVTFNVTFGAAMSIMVLYAIERLHAGDVGFGLLTTATAAGGLVGTACYGWLAARVSLGNLMRIGLIIETLTHLAFALTRSLPVALMISVIFGAHAFVWGTTSTSIRQRSVPTDLQGRVGSVYLIGVQVGIVIGGVIGGVIADTWGVVATLWFAFGGSAALVALMWPQLSHVAHDA